MSSFRTVITFFVTLMCFNGIGFALSSTVIEYNSEYEMVLLSNLEQSIEPGDLVKVSDQCVIEVIATEPDKAIATTDLCITKSDITVSKQVNIEKMNDFLNSSNAETPATTATSDVEDTTKPESSSSAAIENSKADPNKKAVGTQLDANNLRANNSQNKTTKKINGKNTKVVSAPKKTKNKSKTITVSKAQSTKKQIQNTKAQTVVAKINLDPVEKFDFSKYKIRSLKKANMPLLSKPVKSLMSTKQKIVYIEKDSKYKSNFKSGYYFTTHVAAHSSDQEYEIDEATSVVHSTDGFSPSVGLTLGFQKLKQNQFGYKLSTSFTNSLQNQSNLQTLDAFASANVGIQKNIYIFAGGHLSQILSSDYQVGNPLGYGLQAGIGYQSQLTKKSILQNFMFELTYLTTQFNTDSQNLNAIKTTEVQFHLGVPITF